MFLKKIQLSGFKSFADKVTIPLDKGINGVVGPNGSGKSNVIDAVRWVMGEQSAKNLRGKVSTDIIFSGSAKRKPLGMAEVTLVFDNLEPSSFCPPEYRHEPEISLSRRLFADGGREYLINKKPARYKDVMNFFTMTGLGGRSYSMIQQGQVDRILNAKPEDVRVILEEAAGTLVFKMRRDEALKKLLATKENLDRIEDLITELDRQKKTLSVQMEKAKSWQEFQEQIKTEELSIYGFVFRSGSERMDVVKKDLDAAKAVCEDLEKQIAVFESQQAEIQNALDVADPGLDGLREEVSSIREKIVRAESTIGTADERIQQNQQRIDDLDKDVAEDQKHLEIIEAQVEAGRKELAVFEEKTASAKEETALFLDQVEEIDESSRVFLSRVADLEDAIRSIDRQLGQNSVRCEAINRDRERIHTECAELEKQAEILRFEIRDLEKDLEKSQKLADECQSGLHGDVEQREKLDEVIKGCLSRNHQLFEQRDLAKEEYHKRKARLTSLQEFETDDEKLPATLQKLKKADSTGDLESLSVVADYLSFGSHAEELSQNARRSIEQWVERVIVSNFSEVQNLAKAARSEKVGRLDLLVTSQINAGLKEAAEKWAETHDAVCLDTLLDCQGDRRKEVSQVLSLLYWLPAPVLDEAGFKALPPGILVFTNQGLIWGGGFAGSLASSSEGQGVLARKEEIGTLQKTIERDQANLAKIQAEIDENSLKERTARGQVAEIEEKLAGQNSDVLSALADLQKVKQLVDHKRNVLDSTLKRQKDMEASEASAVEQLSQQGQYRIELAKDEEQARRDLEDLREANLDVEERRAEIIRQAETKKLDLAKYEARSGAVKQAFEQNSNQLERLQQALSRRYADRAKFQDEIDRIRSEHKGALDQIEELLRRREVLENELSSKREENAGLLEQLRGVDAKLKEAHSEKAKLQKQTTQFDIELERLTVQVEGARSQALEKYHTELTREGESDLTESDLVKKTKLVAKLREKLDGLGAINMMAIQEYDELMERYNFIQAQKTEVESSITILEDALEEIEETSRIKFSETFTVVDREFRSLFPILFPGGEAHLEMTNPEDPLTTGVELLARLPGKKYQRMTLLSGGEKALTAISLIFALLKTKPTPFCFLDEVDAPLDEANVGRYNRVLEALSEKFQFVVITHNRRTMEVLDTLFGVTMQEPGVSKVVGVDMKKDLPKHLQKAFIDEKRPVEGATAS